MAFPAVTAGYAAVLGVVFALLSAWVVAGRARHRVIHGDGGHDGLARRIRAHANFAEYVPLILLLVALLEAAGGTRPVVHALLLPLLVARVLHPIGMIAREMSLQQFVCRGVSATVTWGILIASSVLLLLRLG